MTPDHELLQQYAAKADEAAFAEFVRRHVDWVYSVALRLVAGDSHLAEDITQRVFTDLAHKAAKLAHHKALGGWLYTSTRFAASKLIDTEQRRRAREQAATAMSDPPTHPDISWEQLRPLLDDAIGALRESDRNLLIWRFFQGKSFGEVGAMLGLSENTARMRVERALEKLRGNFARAGASTSAALLATTLGAHGTTTAPAAFAASLAGKSLAGAAPGTASLPMGVQAIFASKVRVASLAIFATAVLTFLVLSLLPSSGNSPAAAPAPDTSPLHSTASTISAPSTPMNITSNFTRATAAALALSVAPVAAAQTTPPLNPPITAVAANPPGFSLGTGPAAAPIDPAMGLPLLVRANNQFAVDLYRRFDPKPNENAFFSPYSISTALAMTWAGARGQTADQLAKMLNFTNLTPGDITPMFLALQQKLTLAQTATASQLAIANSLWAEPDPEKPFLPAYLDLIKSDFGSEVNFVDFKNQGPAAITQINAWVAKKRIIKLPTCCARPTSAKCSAEIFSSD